MDVEIREMSWENFKKLQKEMTEDNLVNSELTLLYSSDLTIEQIQELPRREAIELIARANKANGFVADDSEKNLDDSPAS